MRMVGANAPFSAPASSSSRPRNESGRRGVNVGERAEGEPGRVVSVDHARAAADYAADRPALVEQLKRHRALPYATPTAQSDSDTVTILAV
jgi:hypothetical protein